MFEINGYAVLDLPTRNDKGKWIDYSLIAIRRAYLRSLIDASPVLSKRGDVDRMADVLAAGEVLLHKQREAHDAAVKGGRGLFELEAAPTLPIPPDSDPLPMVIDLALRWGELDAVLKELPELIHAPRLASVEVLGLGEAFRDALAVLNEERAVKEEDEDAKSDTFIRQHRTHAQELYRWLTSGDVVLFTFRAKAWMSAGRVVHGKASKLSAQVRASLEGPEHARPTHCVTLNLGEWARKNAADRVRLVLHELMHFDPSYDLDKKAYKVKMYAHEIEEFPMILRRFGPADLMQLHAVVAGAAHPETVKRAQVWEAVCDEVGQSLLFALAERS